MHYGHYCTMSQNLFWPPFFNEIFFSKFHFKNVYVFMSSTLSQILLKKFLWESGFPIFDHVTFFFAKRQFVFGRHFQTKHFLIVLFSDILLFSVYTHMVQCHTEIPTENYLKRGSTWTPFYAQTGVKSSLGT